MENDLSTCRKCNLIKVRILSGTFDGRNKRFVDDKGRLWNGRCCPDCNNERIRLQMQKLRLARLHAPIPGQS